MDLLSDNFEQHVVNWLPGTILTPLSICSFKEALRSLLSNTFISKSENFSFPDATSPFLLVSPTKEQEGETIISKLQHGKWLRNTWMKCCDLSKGLIEILVPVILYMDGISLDAHGRLSITSLNITLGIFNVATRKKPEDWETIDFYLDNEFLSSAHSSKADPLHNIKNLHNGLQAALCLQ